MRQIRPCKAILNDISCCQSLSKAPGEAVCQPCEDLRQLAYRRVRRQQFIRANQRVDRAISIKIVRLKHRVDIFIQSTPLTVKRKPSAYYFARPAALFHDQVETPPFVFAQTFQARALFSFDVPFKTRDCVNCETAVATLILQFAKRAAKPASAAKLAPFHDSAQSELSLAGCSGIQYLKGQGTRSRLVFTAIFA
jgi:hypothetical protein